MRLRCNQIQRAPHRQIWIFELNKQKFQERLALRASQIAAELDSLLQSAPQQGEITRPQKLLAAMRHGVLNGGKRLRPFLLMETAQMLGGNEKSALRAAAAIECVHCYSLIHDDLPAMDDDDLRRGQPTVHVAFDEATAILAGDSLLTMAFDILADPQTHRESEVRSQLVLCLARSSGIGGMAGGQILDLAAEHQNWGEKDIRTMQSMKTGALIRSACEMGAIVGKADTQSKAALVGFGELAGRAFQLADDILDVTQSTETLGKQAAKDDEQGKSTLVSLVGVAKARQMANEMLQEALFVLQPFGERAKWLARSAKFIVERDH